MGATHDCQRARLAAVDGASSVSAQAPARQAEIGLRANAKVRSAVSNGHSAVRTVGRVLYVANGCGGVVDDFRLDEVIRAAAPASLHHALSPSHQRRRSDMRGRRRVRHSLSRVPPTRSSSSASSASCTAPAYSLTRNSRPRRPSSSGALPSPVESLGMGSWTNERGKMSFVDPTERTIWQNVDSRERVGGFSPGPV
jgi:hypothetical protein